MASSSGRPRRLMAFFCLLSCLLLIARALPGQPDTHGTTNGFSAAHGTLTHRSNNATITNTTTMANDTIAAARKILAEAMIQQGIYNKYRFDHPRRNSYKPGQKVPLRRRDEGEPEAPHLNATILAASALVAQHDAKAQAANGTLDKEYPPLSSKGEDADASPPSSSKHKRAIENDWWVPAIKRDGSAPMGGSSSYPVCLAT